MQKKLFFPWLCLLLMQLTSISLHAQFQEAKQETQFDKLVGTAIANTATATVTYAPVSGVPRNIKNIISLQIDEASAVYPQSSYTVSVPVKIEAWSNYAGSGSPTTTTNVTLVVNYDNGNLPVYNTKNYVKLPDEAEKVVVTINGAPTTTQTGSWNPLTLVRLENEMRVLRFYTLSNNSTTLTPSFNTAVDNTDAVTVSWTWPSGINNNNSQLEWAWVEDETAGYYTVGGTLDANKLFFENSTRVELDDSVNAFKIPLLYPGKGKLYYRVRATMRKNAGYTIAGPWSTAQNFSFNGHELDLNWQSSTSFAENGKYKSVIQYFDGTLRQRQTVTKDNETGNTIVGETIYDFQGRPNIQILPTPTIDNQIKFFKDFNRFKDQLDETQNPAELFDLTPAALQCNSAPQLDITRGNGKYYSTNNDWLGTEMKSRFIPNAGGYAYTETRYMDDATERVSVQGGVGSNHQIGTGHETKYYYGKPSQQELDALFGTEVGDASHYSKNMVQDANGQMSVSYVDMHGRTIATALAGESPASLDSIYNNKDYQGNDDYPMTSSTITNQLLTPTTNLVKEHSIESVNTLLVPASTDYAFSYELTPAILSQFSITENKNICFDCKYDLEISIRPEDCSGATPIVKKYSNLQLVAADSACGTARGFVGEGITTPTTSISFSQTLATGSWVVRKTLSINDSLFAQRRDSALKVFMVQTEAHLYDSVYALLSAASGCGLPAGNTASCDSCTARLGNYSQYKTKYLAAIGNPVGYDTSGLHAQYSADSLGCASACGLSAKFSTLSNLRQQMLMDMMPYSGQYAIDSVRDATGHATALTSSNAQSVYNIFTVASVVPGRTTALFRVPKNESGTNTSNYYDDQNLPDAGLKDGSGTDLLPLITADDFTSRFKYSWSNNLIYYHPEFNKLKYAEDNLSNAYAWMDKLQSTETYAQAYSAGYTNPSNIDPYFFKTGSGKTTMDGYLVNYLPPYSGYTGSVNSIPSIWQMANGSVLCAGLDDAAKNSCNLSTDSTKLDTRITSTTDKNTAWSTFKSLYMSYRNDMMVDYINTHASGAISSTTMHNLQDDGKRLLFVNSKDNARQSDMGGVWTKAMSGDTTHLSDSVNAYISRNSLNKDNCVLQKPMWKAMLMRCEALTKYLDNHLHSDSTLVDTIITHIVDSLALVCQHSITSQQPDGSTTTPSSYTGSPQSFEEVVNQIMGQYGILTVADSNYFCNPFSIETPKAYGSNPVLDKNYSNKIDSCNCNQFMNIRNEALVFSGGNHGILSDLHWFNQFLQANYSDTLAQDVFDVLRTDCDKLFVDSCNMYETRSIDSVGATRTVDSTWIKLDSCVYYKPLTLSTFVYLPAFLNCGYQKICISCRDLIAYRNQVWMTYSYVNLPYTGDNPSEDEISKNNFWARYINYRTGLSLTTQDYLTMYANCPETIARSASYSSTPPPSPPSEYNYSTEIIYCRNDKPLNDPSRYFPTDTVPCRQSQMQAQFVVELMMSKQKDSLTANFDSLYLAKCLGVRENEQFYATYAPKEYHYTLYYYDQAGSLVKTLPPAAIVPNYGSSYLSDIASKRLASTDGTTSNNELLATNYRYNTLSQVVNQQTPDGGISNFWYDKLGRLSVSQNAKQYTSNDYSYTLYDYLGRITEVGQRRQTTTMTQTISTNPYSLDSWLNNNTSGNKEQITLTVYDIPYTALQVNAGLWQQNLRNRVSYTSVFNNASQKVLYTDGTIGGHTTATFYSYDIHGNVDTLLQDYLGNIMYDKGNRFKKIVYDYDLISGKVNQVAYQAGKPDAFYHRYKYDAENRLTAVQTSRDSLYWDNDARYEYYRHGPMSRMVLGENQVQGMDYAYTIQGWLKGVNSNWCGVSYFDMGWDGASGAPNKNVAIDIFSYSLQYFNGDYSPLYTGINNFAPLPTSLPSSTTGKDLFNGNISRMQSSIPTVGFYHLNGFRYDQLNRLTAMDIFTDDYHGDPGDPNKFVTTLAGTDDWKERISYDPNGNIRTYLRNGFNGTGGLAMDSLTYQYEKNSSSGKSMSNRLRYVQDQASSWTYSEDIDNQTSLTLSQVKAENSPLVSTDNYQYDEIGNLIKDVQAGISHIYWTVYGKIDSISKTDGTGIKYTYDAAGNRILKIVKNGSSTKTTSYVRDASGNVMSVYASGDAAINSGDLTQAETPVYGSSRLGVYYPKIDVENLSSSTGVIFTRGIKLFELSNHLSNVMATIPDRKRPYSNDNATVDHYYLSEQYWTGVCDVAWAGDYAPFGMQMVARTYSNNSSNYRYGFNGKENDNDVKGEGNQQDYGMRIFDPRLGRFLSTDPLTKSFPSYSPFQFSANSPIATSDLDGAEPKLEIFKNENTGHTTKILVVNVKALGSDQFKDRESYMEAVDWATKIFAYAFQSANNVNTTVIAKLNISEANAKDVDPKSDYNVTFRSDGVFFTPPEPPKVRFGEVNRNQTTSAIVASDKTFDQVPEHINFLKGESNFIHKGFPRTDLGVFGHPIIDYLKDRTDPMVFKLMRLYTNNQFSYKNAFIGLTIAHEIGHMMGLTHDDVQNLIWPMLNLMGSPRVNETVDYRLPPSAINRVLDNIKDKTTQTTNDDSKDISELE